MLENKENEKAPPKIYLGNGMERKRSGGDPFFTGTFCVDDIDKIPDEHIQVGKNGKRYIKWILSPYRQGANEYGHTHSFAVDTFKKFQKE